MSRNSSSDAIILRNTPFGEIHKNVTMITRNDGLVRSIAYGALKGKGKLRSLTSPFAYGTVYLYNDPVKESSKITDMDVRSFFESIRENLKKFYTASLWAEIVLYSHGGGEDSETVFDFLLEAMQFLEAVEDERDIGYCSVQFILRYLKILGLQPEIEHCGSCGKSIQDGEAVSFSARESAFVCSDCADVGDYLVAAGILRYLQYTSTLTFPEAVRIRLGHQALGAVKNLMFRLAEDMLERKLNTLKTGEGIL